MLSRRAFLASTASLAVTAGITGAHAVMGPNDKFDLLIKGGDVLDPSQSLRDRRDIGIRYGVIEALEPDIAEARALRVINACKLAGPRRSAHPRLSLRVGYRHSCGRICGQPMRHHLCFGG
jgi:hypothetical protein